MHNYHSSTSQVPNELSHTLALHMKFLQLSNPIILISKLYVWQLQPEQ